MDEREKSHRLLETDKNDINNQLLFLKNYVPKDFVRLPRSLEDIEYYKATELRQFLLYSGPVVLKKIANKNIYTHFMALSCAIRILCSPALYRIYNNYALKLLEYFVQKYAILYGKEYITHNVHGLIHSSTKLTHIFFKWKFCMISNEHNSAKNDRIWKFFFSF